MRIFVYQLINANQKMSRILAVDYGQKRTGLAVTDPLQIIANGLDTVNSNDIVDYLKKYFIREDVELVVIGYPKQMNNSPSDAVRYVNEFIRKFEKNFPDIKYVLMDERFTSKMALQTMIDGGVKKQQRRDKALVDKISATIILQSYMESKANSQNNIV
jgi:putative Holliday junction resolvase